MKNITTDVTLQINLSPGDINYADQTVPALVANHPEIAERLIIVDCCKPQKTKLIDPDKRYPDPEYSERVSHIKKIAERLLHEGTVTKIYFLEEGDPLVAHIAKKYFRNIIKETHEYGGIGITSYLSGLELARTRYVLHFDGDMLLYKRQGFNWVGAALDILDQHTDCISVNPGIAPFTPQSLGKASYEHWSSFIPVDGGFKDSFFSARQFLIDKDRLAKMLPLLKGPALWETLIVKYLNRGYPRSVENIFFKRFRSAGKYRYMMNSDHCWVLHPLNKPEAYIKILPQVLKSVEKGAVPEAQKGHENIILEAWISYLEGSL